MIQRIKTLSFLISLIAALSFAGSAFAEDNPWKVKLPFKTAIVHYDAKGTMKGTETLYIRKGGEEMARVSKLSGRIMFIPMTDDTVEITTSDWIIKVDNKKKKAEKFTNPQKFMIEEYNKLSSREKAAVRKNLKEIGTNMTSQLGGQIQKGAAKHLGYTCDIVSMLGIKVFQMSGTPVVLKTEGSMLGIKMNTIATKLEKNVSVPDNVFQAPAGIKVVYNKEADDLNQQMAKSMIDYLKDPDAAKKQEEAAENVKSEMEKSEREQAETRREDRAGYEEEQPPDEEEEERDFGGMMEKGLEGLKGIFGR